MPERRQRVAGLIAAAVVLAAIVGYVVGHSRSPHRPPPEKILTASAGGVLLNYPSSWRPVATVPAIAGLGIARPLALAPGGDSNQAALVAGELSGTGPTPLPQTFVALIRRVPETEVVNVLGNQVYRYSRLSVTGFPHELTLYAVPNAGGAVTVLACYASASQVAEMRTCDRIVATLTLANQSQSYDLTPNVAYAQQLSASIGVLNGQRVALRAQMGSAATPATLRRTATALASAFASAAVSLARLEPSFIATQAQAVLAASARRARAAYAALAAAAAEENAVALAAARNQVYEAEAGVDRALENFALLGYKAS
jgi:hypothetical protein